MSPLSSLSNKSALQPGVMVVSTAGRENGGFTRLELAVVLAVLVLVVLLLAPAVARSRVSGQSFQCRHNLRQLINGWRMYAADNGDRLPESGGYSAGWVTGWLDYVATNADNTNILLIQKSSLWPYVQTLGAFKCPADESSVAPAGVGRLPRTRSYSMNMALGTYGGSQGANFLPAPPWRLYSKVADITAPSPAGLWVLVDEHPDSVNDGAFAVYMIQQGTNATWVDYPAWYHEGAGGFSFADGHTELHQWKDPRTLVPVTYRYVYNGLPQPNNPDIAWIQARTSAR